MSQIHITVVAVMFLDQEINGTKQKQRKTISLTGIVSRGQVERSMSLEWKANQALITITKYGILHISMTGLHVFFYATLM